MVVEFKTNDGCEVVIEEITFAADTEIVNELGQSPGERVYAKYAWLVPGNNNTYTFADDTIDTSAFGTGTEIIVIDKPGMFLFWSAEDQLAYDWSATDSE